MNISLLPILITLLSCVLELHGTLADNEDDHFVNEWAVEIPGGLEVAERVASQHGYTLVKEIKGIPDHYILHRSDVPHRSRRSANHHTQKLVDDERVIFAAQQQERRRVKRELVGRDLARSIVQRDDGQLNDPKYIDEWYLTQGQASGPSTRQDNARADHRVTDVWKLGITGKGVKVTILDDGLEHNHTDLQPNYDPKASYDFNDNDEDPFPRYDPTNENKHGTRCAGEVSMVANNENCGVGIAFDSSIGGIRMLDGRVTDSIEGDALSYHRKYVDIFSASWGPNDDGKTVEGPNILAGKALELGVKEGRNGKGSLFSWAAGNGGRVGDNCNCDGYTSSIYSLTVASASQFGTSPWYSEKCAATLTTAFSSGTAREGKVTTADLHNRCTNQHTGTSAAAPMAAGMLALLLEANPELNWREVQHIVAHTSRMEPLTGEKGWYKNGAGYCVNLAFGFGLMDALAMVQLADPKVWTPIGDQRICTVTPSETSQLPQNFSSGNYVQVEFTTDGCEGQENEVNFLEHVQLVLNADHQQRGNIYVELESPMGTITTLMMERKYDKSQKGFQDWPLMTTHNWGERPQGTWKFRIADRSKDNTSGKLNNATLVLYGTKEQPEYQKSGQRKDCGDVKTFAEKLSVTTEPPTTDTEAAEDNIEAKIDQLKTLLNSQQGKAKTQEVAEELNNIVINLKNEDDRRAAEEYLKNAYQENLMERIYSQLLKR